MTGSPAPLAGESAIVTGAASGIGRAVVLALAAAGATTLAVDRDGPGLAETVRRAGGSRVRAHLADVARAREVEGYVEAAVDAHGPPTLFFNNAGVAGHARPLTELGLDEWAAVLDVNLSSVFWGLKFVLPHMYAAGRGAIVNTGSIASLQGAANRADYVATKHAVLGLTRCAAAEARGSGVKVNCLCPGPVDTEMVAKFRTAAGADGPAPTPPGEMATPAEIAETVLFLLRPDVPFLTGSAVSVDGGRTGLF